MPVRLLAIDIDGTLLDSRGRLPDAHRDAVVHAAASGIAVALVTGRSFHFARPVADLLPIPLTLILNNGAVVKDKRGATLARHVVPRNAVRHILERTRAYEDGVAIVFDYDPGDEAGRPPYGDESRQIVFERMDWTVVNRRGYFDKNKAFIASSDGPLADALSEDPIQVMFNGGVTSMRELVAQLRSLSIAPHISVALTEYEHRDFSLVDVNAAGCSKGSTLARWVESQGWSGADVMAVGDNWNDVEMLDFAGAAFVMANAADALKSRGYRLTGSNDENGLAAAIETCFQ
ncbi:MAG TPA: HAD-IIB family hydrolase [Vicinamibacterales bacterium]